MWPYTLHDTNFLQYSSRVLLWCDNVYLWRFINFGHTLVECETKFLNAAWQLQATIWYRLLGQRKIVTLFMTMSMATLSCLISELCLSLTLRSCGVSVQTTFPLEYPVYAINRTIFFTNKMVLVWDSGILCGNVVIAFNPVVPKVGKIIPGDNIWCLGVMQNQNRDVILYYERSLRNIEGNKT